MPVIGVRISWLMLARKMLLAALACSAASLASLQLAGAFLDSLLQFLVQLDERLLRPP